MKEEKKESMEIVVLDAGMADELLMGTEAGCCFQLLVIFWW